MRAHTLCVADHAPVTAFSRGRTNRASLPLSSVRRKPAADEHLAKRRGAAFTHIVNEQRVVRPARCVELLSMLPFTPRLGLCIMVAADRSSVVVAHVGRCHLQSRASYLNDNVQRELQSTPYAAPRAMHESSFMPIKHQVMPDNAEPAPLSTNKNTPFAQARSWKTAIFVG